jgi:uncharacterized protein YPO0396
MNRVLSATIILLTAAAVFITACSSDQKKTAEKAAVEKTGVEKQATTMADIKKEAKDLVGTTRTYSEEQIAEYRKKVLGQMDEYRAKLERMTARVAGMHELAQAKLAAEMAELQRKKAAMDGKIQELQKAGSDSFEKLKADLDRGMADMEKAYDETMENLQKK